MRTFVRFTLLAVLAMITMTAVSPPSGSIIRDDFGQYYDQHKLLGSFALYDLKKDTYIFYNKTQYTQQFSPASTFKICNSLIGLETGIIADQNFVIPWDSVVHWNPKWNKDHDLKSAFKNSTVWYYRELARRVGSEKMQYWLKKANYGNMDMSGGLDIFWLKGGLRITPEQQIDFLKRLYKSELPFSKRSTDIVKEIMVTKDTLNYVMRAKTGWADEEKRIVGWYVGYVEKGDNVYFFSNSIQSPNAEHSGFAEARVSITMKILEELKILQ